MNITFLMGNGFDISAELKTGYNDFYKWYCNLPKGEDDSLDVQNFKQDIREYIKRVDSKKELKNETWADFELGLGKYTDRYTKDNGSVFLQCREDVFSKMVEYLKNEQEKFNVENLSDADIRRIRTQLGNFYTALLPSEQQIIKRIFESDRSQPSTIRFISFNYTNVLDKVIEKISKTPIQTWEYGSTKLSYKIDPRVLHVHGKLDEYPILAVHDESQIKNQEILSIVGFREAMIKSRGIQAMGRDWYSKAERVINESRIICIFGMSLGATDKKWWEKISTWLIGSDSKHLVIFQHLDQPISNTSIMKYVINKTKVIDNFLLHCGVSEEKKERLKSRIHVTFEDDSILKLKNKLNVPTLV